jgi:hypothetical protein
MGGGRVLARTELLFLAAAAAGVAEPHRAVHDWLERSGERIVRDGKRIEDPRAVLDHLAAEEGRFVERRLPVYRRLGMVG